MGRPCLLGSALLFLALAQAAAELFALPPGQDSPDDAAPGFYAPPTQPSSPPDAKTPETIMQLSGTTSIAACADLQELFSDLLDSGNIFSRNQLCYLNALDSSSSSSTTTSTGSSSTGAQGQTQNQTPTSSSSPQQLYWFILSAVLPSFEVADTAVLTMGHANGPDVDSFIAAAGVPCGEQLIATTQTEDQDSASVFVYSCNGMLALPGSSMPLTLPALCCTTTPRPPRQASPPMPPSALPPWIEEVEPPPAEPPRSPPPARAPPPRTAAKRPPPPPPPGTMGRAQLTLFVMAPPDRLFCSKLLMACETLAQPYGLAYGNYSCRASYDVPAAEARYGVAAGTAASLAAAAKGTAANASVALTSPYVIVKLAWPARAYSRHFKRLQAALASSVDVFASLGLVPCGTEIRAVLLATSGGVDREDAFGCMGSLPEDYQAALLRQGLRVLPRQQLCCRPPPPPVPPPLPPPRPPPPPRRPPVRPPSVPAPPPSTPAPQPSTPPPARPVPSLHPAPAPPPGHDMSPGPAPGNPYDWGQLPPPEARDSSTYGEVVGGGGVPGAASTSMPQPVRTQGLSREAIAVIAVLAAAAVLSILAALFVLYRRRQSPLRAAAAVINAAALPPIIGYGDDFGGGGAAAGGGGRQLPRQAHHAQQSGPLGCWGPGKDGLAVDAKVQAAGGGGGVERGPGSGPPGGGGGGGLLAMSTSVGSSELTEQSSAGEGLPVLMRDAATGTAATAAALDLRDGAMADSVALVRALTPQRPQPPPAVAAGAAAAAAQAPATGAAVWAQQGVAAPGGSGFGLMDVFRGAAANHICLSAATSAAPSAAGVLEAAGVPQPRGGSGNAPPLGNVGDAQCWSAFHDQEPATGHQQQQRRRDGDDGGKVSGAAAACRPGPAGRAAERGVQGAAAAAAATHGSEQQRPQQQEPFYRPAVGATGLQHAREVTLLELFNKSPLAGAMLCTPSNSSGGAPPSPTGISRSLSPTARRASGGGAGGAAAALPASRPASLSGMRQRSSPAIALERLSVQLAWNIARLSCSVSEAAGGDGGSEDPDGGGTAGEGRDDAARQNRGGRPPDGLRSFASGPQPRLSRWTAPHAASGAQGSPGGGEGDGSTGGSSGSGAGRSAAVSEAPASGGVGSSGTSATAATSSAGAAAAASGWGPGGVLSPEASLSSPAPPPSRPRGSRLADEPTGVAKPAAVAVAAAAPRAGGGSGKFPGANGGGGVDLDISPKELRIQTDGLLGAGAFGSVYRGSYRGQPVAIKVLHHLHFAAGAEGAAGGGAAASGGGIGGGPGGGALLQQKDVDSFRQEIAILRMLAHPNIVRVLGGCAHAGHPFLVMELMPRCLHNVIHGAAGGGLALADALRIATDVARGLAHLHPAIVHRDLKPANILLDASGTAKISDFGLARYHLKPYISTQQPDAGSVAYMAPEGFDPAIGRLSAKCDVYSFGVLLWELITKEHPWAGESNVAIIYRVAVHRMRLPVPADPRVCPPRLAALLDGCMSYQPSDRPDMRHVLSELESMLRIVQEGGVEALMAAEPGRPEAPVRPPPPPPPLALARAPPPPQAHQAFEGPEGAV